MAKSRLIALFLISALALTPIACGAGGSSEETTSGGSSVVVEDDAGREVTVPENPERIGSMAPSITETIFALGAGDRLVGVTTADNYPKEATEIDKIGDYRGPNFEKVIEEDMDVLLVSTGSTTAKEAEEIEAKTRTTVVVVNPQTVEETIASIGLIGRVIGEKDEARALQKELNADLDGIESAVADEPEPTVFYEVWDDPLQTVGPGSFIDDEIQAAGGRNIAADTNESYPSYSEETLLERDPDYYLISETTVEEVESRGPYSSLKAVEEGHVARIDPDLIARPGPRVVEGVRAIAETIHPEAFDEREGTG